MAQPMPAPISAASQHRRQQNARTNGSSSTWSPGGAGHRRHWVHRHVAPQLVPDVLADVRRHRGVKTGASRAVRSSPCTRGVTPPVGSPMISPWPMRCSDQARFGREGAGMHHAAHHLCQRDVRRNGSFRVHAAQRLTAERRRTIAQTTKARRSSPARRAGRARAAAQMRRDTSGSAGPLTATTTRSMTPSSRGSSAAWAVACNNWPPCAASSRACAAPAASAPRATAAHAAFPRGGQPRADEAANGTSAVDAHLQHGIRPSLFETESESSRTLLPPELRD